MPTTFDWPPAPSDDDLDALTFGAETKNDDCSLCDSPLGIPCSHPLCPLGWGRDDGPALDALVADAQDSERFGYDFARLFPEGRG